MAATRVCSALVCLSMAVIYCQSPRMFNFYDTPSYFEAARTLADGHLDQLRTPAYPALLAVLQWLTGGHATAAAAALVMLQNVIYVLSVGPFHRLARRAGGHDSADVWAVTVFYAAFPPLLSWNNLIMTESLAMTGSVFLLDAAVQAADRRSTRRVAAFTGWLAFLLLLRPSMVFVAPVFAVAWCAWLILHRQGRRIALQGLAGVAAATLILLGYMAAFERQYGVFTASSVSAINRYMIFRNACVGEPLIDGDTDPSPIHRAVTHNCLHHTRINPIDGEIDMICEEAAELVRTYGLPELEAYNRRVVAHNPHIVAVCWRSHCRRIVSFPILSPWSYRGWLTRSAPWFEAVTPTMRWLFAFLALCVAGAVALMLRRHTWLWMTTLLLMLGVGNVLVAMIGAQGDWHRLVFPSMPVYLLLLLQCWRAGRHMRVSTWRMWCTNISSRMSLR